MQMAKRRYTEQQLADMVAEILRSLKNKGLRIMDVRAILIHALIAVDYIVDYIQFGGEDISED